MSKSFKYKALIRGFWCRAHKDDMGIYIPPEDVYSLRLRHATIEELENNTKKIAILEEKN
jgi:hypothetical protein